MGRLLVKAIERSDRSNRTCLHYFHYFLMHRCKWLTWQLGVHNRGYMQGHGEAGRPTWEGSEEWVSKGVGTTVRAGKGKAEEVGKTEGKRKLARTRGGREREDKAREKKQQEKEERDGSRKDEPGGEGPNQREKGAERDMGGRRDRPRDTHSGSVEARMYGPKRVGAQQGAR